MVSYFLGLHEKIGHILHAHPEQTTLWPIHSNFEPDGETSFGWFSEPVPPPKGGIKQAYLSRISNATVLPRAQHLPATSLLLKKQLLLLGEVLRAPDGYPMKVASFIPGTLRPATERFVRRVGRPRFEWIRYVRDQALILYGSEEEDEAGVR